MEVSEVTGIERRLRSLEEEVRRTSETLNDHLILAAPLIEQQATIKANVETLHDLVVGRSGEGIVSSVRELQREVAAGRHEIQQNLEAVRHLTRLIVGDGTTEHPGVIVNAAVKKADHNALKKVVWFLLTFIGGAASGTQVLDWLLK